MRVKHKRGIKREGSVYRFPGDSKRVVPRIMLDPSRNMRDHVPGLFCAISCHAEIVLARISIGQPMFIEPTGEMTLIARRVGVSRLDYENVEQIRPVQKRRTNHGIFNRSS